MAQVFISNPSDSIVLKRHELKLTVFAFVFRINALRIYRAMKVRSIVTGLKKRCDNWQLQIFTHILFQLNC